MRGRGVTVRVGVGDVRVESLVEPGKQREPAVEPVRLQVTPLIEVRTRVLAD